MKKQNRKQTAQTGNNSVNHESDCSCLLQTFDAGGTFRYTHKNVTVIIHFIEDFHPFLFLVLGELNSNSTSNSSCPEFLCSFSS